MREMWRWLIDYLTLAVEVVCQPIIDFFDVIAEEKKARKRKITIEEEKKC